MTDEHNPAPPLEAVPCIASPLSWTALWLVAEREYSRVDIRHRMMSDRITAGDRSEIVQRMAIDAAHTRDAFGAICRLIERISADDMIKERLREIKEREAHEAAARDAVADEPAAENNAS